MKNLVRFIALAIGATLLWSSKFYATDMAVEIRSYSVHFGGDKTWAHVTVAMYNSAQMPDCSVKLYGRNSGGWVMFQDIRALPVQARNGDLLLFANNDGSNEITGDDHFIRLKAEMTCHNDTQQTAVSHEIRVDEAYTHGLNFIVENNETRCEDGKVYYGFDASNSWYGTEIGVEFSIKENGVWHKSGYSDLYGDGVAKFFGSYTPTNPDDVTEIKIEMVNLEFGGNTPAGTKVTMPLYCSDSFVDPDSVDLKFKDHAYTRYQTSHGLVHTVISYGLDIDIPEGSSCTTKLYVRDSASGEWQSVISRQVPGSSLGFETPYLQADWPGQPDYLEVKAALICQTEDGGFEVVTETESRNFNKPLSNIVVPTYSCDENGKITVNARVANKDFDNHYNAAVMVKENGDWTIRFAGDLLKPSYTIIEKTLEPTYQPGDHEINIWVKRDNGSTVYEHTVETVTCPGQNTSTETETLTMTETETSTGTETETSTGTETEASTGTETETNTGTETETESSSGTDTGAETETMTGSETSTGTEI